jgi:hypothetical protein
MTSSRGAGSGVCTLPCPESTCCDPYESVLGEKPTKEYSTLDPAIEVRKFHGNDHISGKIAFSRLDSLKNVEMERIAFWRKFRLESRSERAATKSRKHQLV